MRAESLGVRVVCAHRYCLAPGGGALEKMLPPFKMGVGGPLGSGKQWMSWIHKRCRRLTRHAAASSVSGPMNVVGPEAVTNEAFSRTLAASIRRPSFLRAPAFAVRLGLGKMADITGPKGRASGSARFSI